MTVPSSQNLKASGVTAGGQVGYNYQLPASSFGGLVIGVEADGAYTDLKSSATTLGAFDVINQYQSRLDYLGTIRGRLGVAFDRFLVYGTGGFAYGHASLSDSILPPAAAGLNGAIWAGRGGHTQTGYAVGGGIEYAIPTASLLNPFGAGAVTLRAEYLHYDLGTLNIVARLGGNLRTARHLRSTIASAPQAISCAAASTISSTSRHRRPSSPATKSGRQLAKRATNNVRGPEVPLFIGGLVLTANLTGSARAASRRPGSPVPSRRACRRCRCRRP